MDNTKKYYYDKVAEALEYLESNYQEQPNLEQVAETVHISPYHFQKIFTEWVGVSPKKYLQYINIKYAKLLLNNHTLADTAFNLGLSGTGRLHDMFINIEGMTPGEYKNGGRNLSINYNYFDSQFGDLLIASTDKGICHIGFSENKNDSLESLKINFPKASLFNKEDEIQQPASSFFRSNWDDLSNVKLHLKGTEFQLKVWDALLKIPRGQLSTYGNIAEQIGNPKASRAVGTAIGSNPIAYLIPCHRVIQSSGKFGQYRWGSIRKKAIIGWEIAQDHQDGE